MSGHDRTGYSLETTSSALLCLPPELRLIIYKCVFDTTQVICPTKDQHGIMLPHSAAILSTSRLMRQEALPFFWKAAVLDFTGNDYITDISAIFSCLGHQLGELKAIHVLYEDMTEWPGATTEDLAALQKTTLPAGIPGSLTKPLVEHLKNTSIDLVIMERARSTGNRVVSNQPLCGCCFYHQNLTKLKWLRALHLLMGSRGSITLITSVDRQERSTRHLQRLASRFEKADELSSVRLTIEPVSDEEKGIFNYVRFGSIADVKIMLEPHRS